ncbi:MAG: hypothetical protein QXN89_01715, partial [Candidatus Woesearchaeota archaeon]
MKLKIEWFVFAFFILAVVFYLGLDKLPLSHPGNIKAADPFYHTLMVDVILETKQWKYYPYYISYGQERAINQQPPLLYMLSAAISSVTNLPSWTVIYFFVCLSAA